MCMHACVCHLVCLCAMCMQEPLKARRGWWIPVVTKKLGREAEQPASVPTLLGESKECPSAWPPLAMPSSATSDCASVDTWLSHCGHTAMLLRTHGCATEDTWLCHCGHTALHILMHKHPQMFICKMEERNNVYGRGVFWGEKSRFWL